MPMKGDTMRVSTKRVRRTDPETSEEMEVIINESDFNSDTDIDLDPSGEEGGKEGSEESRESKGSPGESDSKGSADNKGDEGKGGDGAKVGDDPLSRGAILEKAFAKIGPDDLRSDGFPRIEPIANLTALDDLNAQEIYDAWNLYQDKQTAGGGPAK